MIKKLNIIVKIFNQTFNAIDSQRKMQNKNSNKEKHSPSVYAIF